MSMEPVRRTSPDLTADNVRRLAELFPSVITETRDDAGDVRPAVDFDLLRQELSDHVVEGPQERYQLDWPGKRAAAFAANAPTTATLRPDREESVDFDTTKNVFIEGDNLEVLKVLQESYLGKVKMIYIDPPYNTGNDFVYNDDFAESTAEYLKKAGDVDEDGARLRANPETNGRFHSDWLSMMYPRLKLARNLLQDDGVILISIDDSEVSNLRALMDEVFGGRNFVAQIEHKSRASVSNDKIISENHNHILLFARDRPTLERQRARIGLAPKIEGFRNPDSDPRGPWRPTPLDGPGGAKKGNPFYEYAGVSGFWRISLKEMESRDAAGLLLKNKNGIQQKYFLSQAINSRRTTTTWWDDAGLNSGATRKLNEMMDGPVFDTPKPVTLIQRMLELFTFDDADAITLDFFAGSGTTGHAVMLQNAQDGGNRRFVLVQLPETPAEKSEAARQGYPTISAVTRERLRRAGMAVIDTTDRDDLDTGFRAFRLDASPFAEKAFTPENTTADLLAELEDPILADRTPEDLLTHVLLAWGLDLAVEIQTVELAGQEVFDVEDGALLAAFSGEVTDELAEAMARREPARAVFLDSGFISDAARINVEQIFREISPSTDVKVL